MRYFAIFIILIILSSCCYQGLLDNSLGSPRKKMNIKKTINNDVYNKIDTTSLYEFKYHITNLDVIIPVDLSFGKTFLKFYGEGKVGEFGLGYDHKNNKLIPNYKFKRDDLNPKNFRMGYFYTDKDEIKMRKFGIKFCRKNTFISKIEVSGDTITEYILTNSILNEYDDRRVYIRTDVKKEYVEGWKPDW